VQVSAPTIAFVTVTVGLRCVLFVPVYRITIYRSALPRLLLRSFDCLFVLIVLFLPLFDSFCVVSFVRRLVIRSVVGRLVSFWFGFVSSSVTRLFVWFDLDAFPFCVRSFRCRVLGSIGAGLLVLVTYVLVTFAVVGSAFSVRCSLRSGSFYTAGSFSSCSSWFYVTVVLFLDSYVRCLF